MQMLQSDCLSYLYTTSHWSSGCRSSTKCDDFIVFFQFWKKVQILKVPEKTKRGTLTVAWLQKLENIAKEGACLNNCKFAKVAKDSSIYVQHCSRAKFNNAWRNNGRPLFMSISVRILLKLYKAIVDSAFSLINYHLIEISSS